MFDARYARGLRISNGKASKNFRSSFKGNTSRLGIIRVSTAAVNGNFLDIEEAD